MVCINVWLYILSGETMTICELEQMADAQFYRHQQFNYLALFAIVSTEFMRIGWVNIFK